jgi:hypothetical protein
MSLDLTESYIQSWMLSLGGKRIINDFLNFFFNDTQDLFFFFNIYIYILRKLY